MCDIVPAIIPKSLRDLRQQLQKVSFVSQVQIDVVDGKFVETISWPYAGEVPNFDLVEPIPDIEVEVDLMVAEPLKAAEEWYKVGAKRFIFHIESLSAKDIEALFEWQDTRDVLVALSLNNDTPLRVIAGHLDWIDYVQLMGIAKIGSQGQPFDDRVLDRIAALRGEHPDLVISIDGSVNEDTLLALKAAGASRLVVGSAIMKHPNPLEAYQNLLALVKNKN